MIWRPSESATSAEALVEFAGRTCYLSFGDRQHTKSTGEYIQRLITKGHHSVLEHANWTFLLKNISRATATQITRHRIGWAFSQLSQQYYDAPVGYVLPPQLRGQQVGDALRPLLQQIELASLAIDNSLTTAAPSAELEPREELRMSRAAKRAVLPNMTATHLVCTANARALRHFLVERGSIPGDPEMREICVLLFKSLLREAPVMFHDFALSDQPDSTGSVKTA